MASLGLDLGDDDVHAAELATCVRAARVHCVVHSGGDLHAIHTAVRVMLGAARTRTGDRRHALYRRRHTGHDMVEWRLHEAIAVYTLHARSPAPVRRASHGPHELKINGRAARHQRSGRTRPQRAT